MVAHYSNKLKIIQLHHFVYVLDHLFSQYECETADNHAEPNYRMHNPYITDASNHIYTTDADEVASNKALGWQDEGVYFYGLKIG